MTITEIKQLVMDTKAFKEYCEKQVVKVIQEKKNINILIPTKSYLDNKGREVIWGVGDNKDMYTLHVNDSLLIDYVRTKSVGEKYTYSRDGHIITEEEFYELLEESEDK